MKILVLGSGAREHAIILALRSEEAAHTILAAPGNAGIAQDAEIVDLNMLDGAAVASVANTHGVGLV
ncbi:MAG: phosphoribosylamine--glycine ligase family protein, partial [Microbacterium sp.]